MLELELSGWILAVIAAFAVGLSKGGLGMIAVLSVPLLSLVMSPVQAAALLLPIYIISDMGGLIVYRRNVDLAVMKTVLPGAIVGIGIGWATAHIVPENWVTLLVGVIGLVFALMTLLRSSATSVQRPADMLRGSFWGGIAGFTSFVSHSGAPPYQVYVQPLKLSPAVYAGTTTWCFAAINLVKLIPYAALGQFSAANLAVAFSLMPVALIAVWIGMRLVRIIPFDLFYLLITWGLLLVSLRLIWQALAG